MARYYIAGLMALLLAIAAFNYRSNQEEVSIVDDSLQSIESVRAQYDMHLMKIEGVVVVSTGLGKDGKPCLKIGTAIPTEQVRKHLPEDLFRIPVELEYVGKIEAQ